MGTFEVKVTIPVTHYETRVLMTTDDPMEAYVFDQDLKPIPGAVGLPWITGVHPTHTWPTGVTPGNRSDAVCLTCGAPNNGSFKAKMPCGWEGWSERVPFIVHMGRWRAEHQDGAR